MKKTSSSYFTYNIKQIIALRLIEKEYCIPHIGFADATFPMRFLQSYPSHLYNMQQKWNTNILFLEKTKNIVATYIYETIVKPSLPKQHYLFSLGLIENINPFISNCHISNDIKTEYIRMLYKIQNIYFAFNHFARQWKLKKYEKQQTMDLYMNDLDPKSKYTFQLIQEKKIYYFSITDIKQIILNSLTATSGFFSVPTIIKNPYNGVPFSKSDLYNIYFHMCYVSRLYKIHPLIHSFFSCEFNIYEFKRKYEGLIIEYVVDQYIKTANTQTRISETMRMIRNYDRMNIISITDTEKNRKLVDFLCIPYFSLHLMKKYTFDNGKRHNIDLELSWRIKRFLSYYSHIGENAFFESIQNKDSANKIMAILNGGGSDRNIMYKWMANHKYDDKEYNRYLHYGIFGIPPIESVTFRPRSYGPMFRDEIEEEQRNVSIIWNGIRRQTTPNYRENDEPYRIRRLIHFETPQRNTFTPSTPDHPPPDHSRSSSPLSLSSSPQPSIPSSPLESLNTTQRQTSSEHREHFQNYVLSVLDNYTRTEVEQLFILRHYPSNSRNLLSSSTSENESNEESERDNHSDSSESDTEYHDYDSYDDYNNSD